MLHLYGRTVENYALRKEIDIQAGCYAYVSVQIRDHEIRLKEKRNPFAKRF